MPIKILTLSSLYPSSAEPRRGIFTEHRLRNLLRSERVAAKVLSPVEWFPIRSGPFRKYEVPNNAPSTDCRYGIDVRYPRFPVVPKIGTHVSPLLLATSLIKPVRSLIREGFDFDIFDSYYFYPDGVAAVMLGRLFNKPVVITGYGTDLNLFPKLTLPRLMIRWAAINAAGITTVCQSLKDRLTELGIDSDSVRVIYHGVDHEQFRPPTDRDELRKRLGMTRTSLLSVGNLIELKGHHIAIDALVNLPDVSLYLAGKGPCEEQLRRLAESRDVADRVHFLGELHQDILRDWYGASDALILPSRREGIANVLLESMACGTPVVATGVGGIPELINVADTGVIMKNRTPQGLVDSVNSLLENYPDRAATRRYAEKFTWEQTTIQHLNLLEDVLSS